MSRALRIIALWTTLALPDASVEAHEFWLAPSQYVAKPGVVVEVQALTGEGFRGKGKSWSPPHSVRFMALTVRTIDLTRAATPGDFVWTRFAATDSGGSLLGFESGFTAIELPAPQFNAYLEEDGLDGPLAARRRSGDMENPGRERYRRCAKTWLAGQDTARATTPLGLPVEIIPLAAPGTKPVLRARVLWNGQPLPGALVNAWRAPLAVSGSSPNAADRVPVGIAWRGRTDARGEVSVPITAAGEWLVSLVHMVPCAAPDEADWESTWASLTFLAPR